MTKMSTLEDRLPFQSEGEYEQDRETALLCTGSWAVGRLEELYKPDKELNLDNPESSPPLCMSIVAGLPATRLTSYSSPDQPSH